VFVLNRKLSKYDTLQMALSYIEELARVLNRKAHQGQVSSKSEKQVFSVKEESSEEVSMPALNENTIECWSQHIWYMWQHGRRKDFFQGGASRGFSQNFFQGGPKIVKFCFYPSKLKKQPFLLIISKSREALAPLTPPSDAHVWRCLR